MSSTNCITTQSIEFKSAIKKYILGAIRAESVSASCRLGDFAEEDIVIYRGYAFKTKNELIEFVEKELGGDIFTHNLAMKTISSWSEDSSVASDFCYGSGINYYNGKSDEYLYNIILCQICAPESVIISCYDNLEQFPENVRELIRNDSEFILMPGNYQCELYKCSDEVAEIFSITDSYYLYL